MNAKDFINLELQEMRGLFNASLQDITEEQFNWIPGSAANPIRAIAIHAWGAEDYFIQTILQNKPRIFETEHWGEKLGLPNTPGQGRGWEAAVTTQISLAKALEYYTNVQAATAIYCSNITDEELQKTVQFFKQEISAAKAISRLLLHSTGHAGEIAALRGMQGVKGLPF